MQFIDTDAQNAFIVEQTWFDLLLVETAMSFEHEYMYALGLIDGPEPPWLWYDPEEFLGHPRHVDIGEICQHMAERLDIPNETSSAIFEAELSYLQLRGVV